MLSRSLVNDHIYSLGLTIPDTRERREIVIVPVDLDDALVLV